MFGKNKSAFHLTHDITSGAGTPPSEKNVIMWTLRTVSFWCFLHSKKLFLLKESHFNAGFHWNPLDGKSPHSLNDFSLRVRVKESSILVCRVPFLTSTLWKKRNVESTRKIHAQGVALESTY